MSRILKNIGIIFITLIFVGVAGYFTYLLTIGLLLDASKYVYFFGLAISIPVTLFITFGGRKNEDRATETALGIGPAIVLFLLLFVGISWLGALASDFFAGYSPPLCSEDGCDDLGNNWIP
jgi:hypothetical protein